MECIKGGDRVMNIPSVGSVDRRLAMCAAEASKPSISS